MRASEEQFHRAFDSAAVGMALVEPVGRLLQVNRALCEMLGYPEGELLAINMRDLMQPDDRLVALAAERQMMAGTLPASQCEVRYRHKQGGFIWTLEVSTLLRDGANHPLHFITQIQDITRRKSLNTGNLRPGNGGYPSRTSDIRPSRSRISSPTPHHHRVQLKL